MTSIGEKLMDLHMKYLETIEERVNKAVDYCYELRILHDQLDIWMSMAKEFLSMEEVKETQTYKDTLESAMGRAYNLKRLIEEVIKDAYKVVKG